MRHSAIVGGAIVRAVYAADMFSISLRGPDGQTTKDDLTLRLAGVKTRLIERDPDPPPLTASLEHDRRAPCPQARAAAERLIKRGAVIVEIPNTGEGWLDTLTVGAVVQGKMLIQNNGASFSVADQLVALGHCLPIGDE